MAAIFKLNIILSALRQFNYEMNKWITIFLVIVSQYGFKAYSQSSGKDVYILGTTHFGNSEVNVTTYLKLFTKIQPDIILVELDSNAVNRCRLKERWGAGLAKLFGLYKPAKEDLAVKKYQAEYKNTCIVSFDAVIPDRGKYIRKFNRNTRKLFNSLDAIFMKGRMNKDDSAIYNRFISLNNAFFKTTDYNLQVMNSEKTTNMGRILMKYKIDSIPKIINNYEEVAKLKRWYNDDIAFWKIRNEQMCQSIINTIIKKQAKRIIILTGLLHRYYIADYLNEKNKEGNFKIRELVD